MLGVGRANIPMDLTNSYYWNLEILDKPSTNMC